MKKIIIALIIILQLCACTEKNNTNNTNNTNNKPNKKTNIIKEEKQNEYIDNNPIKLGLYLYNGPQSNRTKQKILETNWILNVDLCSLEVYFTEEDEIPGTNQKKLFNNYLSNYQNINNYKIGYKIEFQTPNEKISKTILTPNDTNIIYDYMQIYLYDDINQNASWYDHIDNEEYNENTILSSIKLTGSTKTDEITSDITLTAFTYDTDDLDETNNYRGNSKYSVTIKRK